MSTKLIGVTARVLYENKVRKQFVNERYITQFHKRGYNTILLTLDNPNIDDVLNLCDGFLITGGSDFDPLHYKEANNGLSKDIEPSLDTLDKKVVEFAQKNKLPMLGICRGHQAINVFLGGTLYQDVPNHSGVNHEVKTIKNRAIAFPELINTNSWHHQAVKDLAPDFEIIARAADGTVEAILHKTLPFIGIQWHPEVPADDPITKLIFDAFVDFIK